MDLTVQNLHVTICRKEIIRDVSLSIQHGEFVGIIGPNGSGKSTLLRTIYRLVQPDKGKIIVNGRELSDISLAESARNVGVVGQFHSGNFEFTAMEMIMMGRTPHKRFLEADTDADYAIAWDALCKVGMEKHAERRISTLSGGERQRIILARALAQQPGLLLLDELTNHLDIHYQIKLLSLVKSLKIGVLAALHDLTLAAMYCDRIYVMKDGMVVAGGRPKEVITSTLIRDIYEIDCVIHEDRNTGYLSVMYLPMQNLADL